MEHKKQEVDQMLAMDVLTLSKTEWSSLIVFVSKKDDTLRFCVDHWKANAGTICNSYPVLRMD